MFRKVAAAAVVSALVLTAAVAVQAGSTAGRILHSDVVRPFSTDQYQAVFTGGVTTYLGVRGDHDTDLDLYVYDENGNLIAADTDGSDTCLVSFTPRWTGMFTIRIVNRGALANAYMVVSN